MTVKIIISEEEKADRLLNLYDLVMKWDAGMNADYLTNEAFRDISNLINKPGKIQKKLQAEANKIIEEARKEVIYSTFVLNSTIFNKMKTTCVCCHTFNSNMGKFQAYKCACQNSCPGLNMFIGKRKIYSRSYNPNNLSAHELQLNKLIEKS